MPPLQWQIVKLDGTNLPTCDQICGRLYWIAAASFHLLLISKLLSHLWAVFWGTFKPCMCLFYFRLSWHMDWAERLCREILRFGFTLPVAGLNNFPKSDKENLLCVPISSQGCLDQFPLWSILLPKKRRGGFATKLPFYWPQGEERSETQLHMSKEKRAMITAAKVLSQVISVTMSCPLLPVTHLPQNILNKNNYISEGAVFCFIPSPLLPQSSLTQPILEACFTKALHAKHTDTYTQTIYIS